jgi:hypothetical protein
MTNLSASKKGGTLFLLCLVMAIASPAQTFTTLATFDGINGAEPDYMSLVQGVDGAFYGTTLRGGDGYAYCGNPGCGTVLRISPSGTLTTVDLVAADGVYAMAGLILATNWQLLWDGRPGWGQRRGHGRRIHQGRHGDSALQFLRSNQLH